MVGAQAIVHLKTGKLQHSNHENVELWPNVFSAIQAIVNCVTSPHQDPGAVPTMYDLLLSIGTQTSARIEMEDIRTTFNYTPGTAVLICGRVLLHAVPTWEDGERICLAHYMRDMIHDRLELE